MALDPTGPARDRQAIKSSRAGLTDLQEARRLSPSASSRKAGLYFAEVLTVQTVGPSSEQRYELQLDGGWSRADTGLRVSNAMVADDSADALGVGDKVLAWHPADGGPTIIISGGGSATVGVWRSFGEHAWLNQSGI